MFEALKIVAARLHLFWILFYILIIGGAIVYAHSLYVEHDNDRLPSGNIDLLVNKAEYQLGDVVAFTVVNHFPTTIYVTNHCPEEPLNVYRWLNEEWVQIHDTAIDKNSKCYSQERNVAIPSEGSRGYDFTDWPNLFKEPGVYRIAMIVDHYSDIPFQDFIILQPAEEVEVVQEVVKTKEVVPTPIVAPVPIVDEVPDIVVEEIEEEPEEVVAQEEEYQEPEEDHEEREEHEEEDD